MSCKVDQFFEIGDIENVSIEVTKTGGLVSVENEKITIYRCDDMSVIIADVDISANTEAITSGFKITHLFNTTGLLFGAYILMFEFTRDGLPNKRKKRVNVYLKEVACNC